MTVRTPTEPLGVLKRENEIDTAAAGQWLADNWDEAIERPLSVVLREKFGATRPQTFPIIAYAIRMRKGAANVSN